MTEGDSLGDRMKGYELASRTVLPRRLPVIIRVDGKAFHTVTRGFVKPFDADLVIAMNRVAIRLCEEIQGAQLGFVQSDEVSVLVHGYKRHQSQPWFENQVQKTVSVAASCATASWASSGLPLAMFDARAFVLPEAEVSNYFVWRQQDAVRNSVQMVARAHLSHRECHQQSCSMLQERLFVEKGINWNDTPVGLKRGRCALRHTFEREGVARSEWRLDEEPPTFTQDRAYIERHLALESEAATASEETP